MFLLECCVDSVVSAMAAVAGGANRLELCGNLPIGGTTPEPALLRQIRRRFVEEGIHWVKIRCLIRPRFGDFCYSESEMDVMEDAIKELRECGADGFAIGVLRPDGSLYEMKMKRLIKAAEGLPITLHRAFDMCKDPTRAMETAISLGIDTILTSGQEASAEEGVITLARLHTLAAGRIHIMAGAGINAEVIQQLYPETGIHTWHMSGKVTIESKMRYRQTGVSMGLPSMSEYEIWRTSEQKVRQAAEVLHCFQKN